MPRKLSILVFLILSFIALMLGFKQTAYQPTTVEPQLLAQGQYSWQIFNSTTWKVSDETPDKQTVVNAKSIHYQDKFKVADFNTPSIIDYSPDKVTAIQSKTAHSQDDSEITFEGNVVMKSLSIDTNTNKTLLTEKITYNNLNQQLTSNVKVTLYEPQLTISSIGFIGNIQTGNYEFLSNVKTHYQPQENYSTP